jgi:hypothetical protein
MRLSCRNQYGSARVAWPQMSWKTGIVFFNRTISWGKDGAFFPAPGRKTPKFRSFLERK